MRILTISNCRAHESQGSGYVIANFARGLRNLGHEVYLYGPDYCLFGPWKSKARSLRIAYGMSWRARSLVKRYKPDLVEFYGGEAWMATQQLSKNSSRKFSIVQHSNGIELLAAESIANSGLNNTLHGDRAKWYQGRLRLPVERAFTYADAIVTVSQAEAEFAINRSLRPGNRVIGIENALDDQFLGKPFLEDRPNVIGFCGSWLIRKGTRVLVRDITAILRSFPDWELHLVGVGNEFCPGEYFSPELLPRIRVTGFVGEKAKLCRIYNSWAIAVMPSVYESFGLVASEAMACGCALVANRTGFAATLQHEENAMLMPCAESPWLQRWVKQLIEHPSLRRKLAYSGWLRVQTLTWNKSIRSLENYYLQLIRERQDA